MKGVRIVRFSGAPANHVAEANWRRTVCGLVVSGRWHQRSVGQATCAKCSAEERRRELAKKQAGRSHV